MANINGNGKDNKLIGTNNDDTIKGKGGKDVLKGKKGDDLLKGGSGNDKLYDGVGNDTVFGGKGSDKFFAGKGSDDMYGGGGKDKFYYDGGKLGDDRIWDFQAGKDKLYISESYGFDSVKDVIKETREDGDTYSIDLSNGDGKEGYQIHLIDYTDNDKYDMKDLADDIILIA